MSTRTTFRGTALAGLVLVAGLMACDDDTTGTSQAQISAVVHDQNPDAQSVTRASLFPLQSSSSFNGSFSGDARVELSVDGQTWVQLGDASQVDVALQSSGDETTVHSNASVPLKAFARARLILDGANAEIESGSTVGTITLSSNVTLTVGSSGQVIIEKQFDQSLNLSAGSSTTVTFDLNSEAWVTEENVQASAISESEIQSAVTVQASSS